MKKIDWTSLGIMTLAVCAVLSLIIQVLMIGFAERMADSGPEYQRGKIEAQSRAWDFIKWKINEKKAVEYLRWIEVEK